MSLPPEIIRQHRIRTAPDWALSVDDDKPQTWNYHLIWAAREGIDPPPTRAEVDAELQRRAECEALNRSNLPSVLATMPDYYFIIRRRDLRPLRQLIGWLWHTDYRRMHMTVLDLQNERVRRGLPTALPSNRDEW